MKAVMYGAGNIGRGFIGQIFSQSGYELCFIDVAEPVIEAINREGRYPVRILSGETSEDIWIEGVRAINGRNEEAAAEAIACADIMATAVGVRVLPFIAPVIAAGLRKRFASSPVKPLNIIICENLIDANKVLEELVKKHLNAAEQKLFNENVGLVEASIGRMVPIQTEEMQDGNPLRICVESYSFLPVDKAAFRGEIPSLKGMRPFMDFDFFIKRKLFVHNMGHAICAYLGMIRGDSYIYEAASSGGILYIAQNAMMESALALSAKYNAPIQDLHYHIRDLLRRFTNRALGDTCARVGGDTVRKLGSNDRLIGAISCCTEMNIRPVYISVGTAAALYCHLKETGKQQTPEAARNALSEISGMDINSREADMIITFYSMLGSPGEACFEDTICSIIKAAADMGQEPDII